jgi:ParB-like chromosome segregation protein Spo0J
MREKEYAGQTYTVSDAHPAADALPWHLDKPDFAEIVANMRAAGFDQSRAIVRHHGTGRIIGGRRRELAALVAGLQPVYQDVRWDDEEITEFVTREDLLRRNLTASERAAAAVELNALLPRGGDPSTKGQRCPLAKSASEIAAEAGVGEKTVDAAAKVKKKAPELFSAVKEGRLSAHDAAKVADLPKREREKVAAAPDPKKAAKAAIKASPKKDKARSGGITITAEDERAEKAKREQPKDALGRVIPPSLRDTFGDAELGETVAELRSLLAALDARYQRVLRSLSRKPYKFCNFSQITDQLNQIVNPKSGLLPRAIDGLVAGVPHVVCKCGSADGCKDCRTGGYLPEWRAKELGIVKGGA